MASRTRVRMVSIVLICVVLGVGCPMTDDVTPPQFQGLAQAEAVGLSSVILSWLAAQDDQSPPADIVYRIWMATDGQPDPSTEPGYSTEAGETTFTVPDVPAYRAATFLVRAEDAAGNIDTNVTTVEASTELSGWSFVDGGTSLGTPAASPEPVALAVAAGQLYATWVEYDTQDYLRAGVYGGDDNAPDWSEVDGGAPGLKHTSGLGFVDGLAESLVSFQDRLYATWTEDNGVGFSVRVAVYDPARPGDGWSLVDGGSASGLSVDSTTLAYTPALAVVDANLYVAWSEFDDGYGAYVVHARRYGGSDASPTWSVIDGGALNYDTVAAREVTAAGHGGRLFVAWVEAGQVRARSYDGAAWSAADGGAGLNYVSTNPAGRPFLVSGPAALYLSWREEDGGIGHARVRAYDGTSWSFVDGGGTEGINIDPSKSADAPVLAVVNGVLYALFAEGDGAGVRQMAARVLAGPDTTPVWTTLGGGPAGALNTDTGFDAYQGVITGFEGRLYLTYAQTVDGSGATVTRVLSGD